MRKVFTFQKSFTLVN